MFRLFADILSLIPPPPLVDAICVVLDAALRQAGRFNEWGVTSVAEQVNTSYAERVCTHTLAKALCDLVALGGNYASRDVFAAMRHCLGSPEFRTLVEVDPVKLQRLCVSDSSGIVVHTVQQMQRRRLLAGYSTSPFPKPDFPLTRACLPFKSPARSVTLCVGFFTTNPAAFDVVGSKITQMGQFWETLIVHPSVDSVCFFVDLHLTPASQGKWQLSALLIFSSQALLSRRVKIHSGQHFRLRFL
jgi:hypothetical protein